MVCMSSTAWAQADLWIKDNAGDTGAEPNTTTSTFWASPSIGISWPNANTLPLKANPAGGALNWVHVTVVNKGNAPSSGTEKVYVYYSAASLGLSWSTQWINYTPTTSCAPGTVFGDLIGSATVPVLAGFGGTTDVVIQWWAPDPTNYPCISQPGHFCMIARIEPGITYTETTSILYNTQYNNNIAWRNWSVVKVPPGTYNPVPATVITRNVKDVATTMKLRVALPDDQDGNVFDNADVDMVLDNELFQKWQANGAQGENIEDQGDGIIRLLNADAWIDGIPMDPEEAHEVGLQFTRTNDDFTGTGEIDLIQEDDGDVTGGERFEANFAQDDGADGLVTGVPDESNGADGISVYPNPAQTEFTISNTDKSASYSVRILDVMGREVYSSNFSGNLKINVEKFSKGVYYVEMKNVQTGTQTIRQITVN